MLVLNSDGVPNLSGNNLYARTPCGQLPLTRRLLMPGSNVGVAHARYAHTFVVGWIALSLDRRSCKRTNLVQIDVVGDGGR